MKFRNIIFAALLLVPLTLPAQAPGANIFNLYHAGVPGAGVAIQCGGDQSGIRGAYLCDIDQNANEINGHLPGRELQRRLFCVHAG